MWGGIQLNCCWWMLQATKHTPAAALRQHCGTSLPPLPSSSPTSSPLMTPNLQAGRGKQAGQARQSRGWRSRSGRGKKLLQQGVGDWLNQTILIR